MNVQQIIVNYMWSPQHTSLRIFTPPVSCDMILQKSMKPLAWIGFATVVSLILAKHIGA
jgi:hypothetical protein